MTYSYILNPVSFPWAVDSSFLVHGSSFLLPSLAALGKDEHAHCRWQHGALHLHIDGPDSHSPGDQTGIWWETKTTKSRIPCGRTEGSNVNVNGGDRSGADLMWHVYGRIPRGPGAAFVRCWPEEGVKPSLAQPVAEDRRPAGDATQMWVAVLFGFYPGVCLSLYLFLFIFVNLIF